MVGPKLGKYTGPKCPNGGEMRLSLRHNSRLTAVWCTCFSQERLNERLPIGYWHYDNLAEVKTGDLAAVKAKWREHCDEMQRKIDASQEEGNPVQEDALVERPEAGGV